MEYYPNETAHNPFLSYLQTERLISLFVEASGAIGKNEDVKSGLGSNWPGTLCKMCSPVICTDVDRPPLPRTRRHPWSIPLPHPALLASPFALFQEGQGAGPWVGGGRLYCLNTKTVNLFKHNHLYFHSPNGVACFFTICTKWVGAMNYARDASHAAIRVWARV